MRIEYTVPEPSASSFTDADNRMMENSLTEAREANSSIQNVLQGVQTRGGGLTHDEADLFNFTDDQEIKLEGLLAKYTTPAP